MTVSRYTCGLAKVRTTKKDKVETIPLFKVLATTKAEFPFTASFSLSNP